jgi:hypothetical protein
MEQMNGKQPNLRRSKAQLLDLVKEYDKNPGLTIKAFCKLHQISEGSFYNARSRYLAKGASKQKPSGFIALSTTVLKEPAGNLFAEVNGIKLFQPVPADYLKALVL